MKIAIVGAHGRMGRAMGEGIAADHEIVARLDSGDEITPETLAGAELALEFTEPSATLGNVLALIDCGVHCVVGTTGWNEESLAAVRDCLAQHPNIGVLIAPNFALSAVLAMSYAAKAAPFFETAEVVEYHHPDKLDAPSGTAIATAKAIAAARKDAGMGHMADKTKSDLGSRGADIDGVRVHALRVRGMTAHEEIIFGNPGEQLILRTDCVGRESFVPGVLAAIREAPTRPGLTYGLENIL